MNPLDLFDMTRRRGGSRCTEVGRRIQDYLDGQLDADTMAKVARHLDACRRCGLTAADYTALKQALAQSSATVPTSQIDRLRDFARSLGDGDLAD